MDIYPHLVLAASLVNGPGGYNTISTREYIGFVPNLDANPTEPSPVSWKPLTTQAKVLYGTQNQDGLYVKLVPTGPWTFALPMNLVLHAIFNKLVISVHLKQNKPTGPDYERRRLYYPTAGSPVSPPAPFVLLDQSGCPEAYTDDAYFEKTLAFHRMPKRIKAAEPVIYGEDVCRPDRTQYPQPYNNWDYGLIIIDTSEVDQVVFVLPSQFSYNKELIIRGTELGKITVRRYTAKGEIVNEPIANPIVGNDLATYYCDITSQTVPEDNWDMWTRIG
ncbi:hypothetical protein [Burkholderia phage BCSR5]|nr:hypothetical protein [Burkholderia phage BCSR5]